MQTTQQRQSASRSLASLMAFFAVGFCLTASGDFASAQPASESPAAVPRKTSGPALWHNEDCTNFFYYHDIAPGQAGAQIDQYIDNLADAGVTVLVCNTNSRRTCYQSAVWQSYWDGFDPAGPDDQPFLAPLAREAVPRYRKMVNNMLQVDRQGIDYPARVIERCRRRGVAPWITLRMNDVHENNNLAHPFHSPLWRRPELFRQGDSGYFARALDYAHAEVRDHYRVLVVETLERYDIDGLELDFMREPYLFSVGKEAAGREILTTWITEVRRLVDEAARRRGHAIALSVRVPSTPETALGLGLDAPAWTSQRLVDVVIVTPRWATLEFDLPLERWRKLLGPCTLLAGQEVNYRPFPAAAPRLVTVEQAVGAGVAALQGGADAIYLFNYYQDGHPGWSPADYQKTLRAMRSLDSLTQLARRHALTYRDVTAPGEDYRPPLPASGSELSFRLPLGPAPPPDWQAQVVIELSEKAVAAPQVFVGGVAGTLRDDQQLDNDRRQLTYSIPLSAIGKEARDTIEVRSGDPVTLVALEVALNPPSK